MRTVALLVLVGVACVAANPALRGDEIEALLPVLAEIKEQGPTPVCLFVHGLGQKPSSNILLNDFPEYWGKATSYVSKFCTPKYFHFNSVDFAWTDKALQKVVCDQVAATGARIVFSHSMGNNIVGGAIMNNVTGCHKFAKYSADGKDVKAGSTFWVSLQGVFNGSPAADFCKNVCEASLKDFFKHPSFKKLALGLSSKIPPLRDKCGCPGPKKVAGAAINSCSLLTRPSAPWQRLQQTARDYSWRALCGLGPIPVTLKPVDSLLMPIPYVILEAVSGYGSDFKTKFSVPYSGTDGFVNFHSCNAGRPDKDWGTTPASRLYVGRMNHGDGTGRAGDGREQDKKPLLFMQESVKALLPRIR